MGGRVGWGLVAEWTEGRARGVVGWGAGARHWELAGPTPARRPRRGVATPPTPPRRPHPPLSHQLKTCTSPPPPSCHHPTLQAAVKAIAARVARAGIDDLFGAASAGGPAVGAGRDDPKKLDLVAVSPGGG